MMIVDLTLYGQRMLNRWSCLQSEENHFLVQDKNLVMEATPPEDSRVPPRTDQPRPLVPGCCSTCTAHAKLSKYCDYCQDVREEIERKRENGFIRKISQQMLQAARTAEIYRIKIPRTISSCMSMQMRHQMPPVLDILLRKCCCAVARCI